MGCLGWNFRKKNDMAAAILSVCLILFTGCSGADVQDAGMTKDVGNGEQSATEQAQQAAERRKSETVSFGEESEWESWTDYLYQAAKEETYAFAFIEAGSSQADFDWGYYDDREALTDAFLQEKCLREADSTENVDLEAERTGAETESAEEAQSWCFLKLRIDSGVCGMDIYDYFTQYFAEEGYIVEAWTIDEGNAYAINLDWQNALDEEFTLQYTIRTKRKIIVQNGFLYLLSCEDVNDDNREDAGDQMYAYEQCFEHREYGGGWYMDEDTIYWSDHTARTTTLTDPERRFVEERASDATWPDKLMGYFGLVSEAEYRIQIAPDMPEMTVTFRLKEELPREGKEVYLFNGFVMDETYQMEIRTVGEEELVQRTDVQLSIEKKDIISFEDLDGDGYLDMRILCPTHESGADELYVKEEDYWVWDLEKEKMIRVSDSELLARRSGAGEEPDGAPELEISQTIPGYVPVTVKKGDSLWKISEVYYGDGKYWTQIYEYNRSVIGDNPSLIYEGTELIFPFAD